MGLEQAARQIIVDWDSGIHLYEAITALREALAEQPTHKFIPVGIVNDQHCITWMEEIVDDQAPIGSILYAKEQS